MLADVQVAHAGEFCVLLRLSGGFVQLATLPSRYQFVVVAVDHQQRATDVADVSQRIETVADYQSVQRDHWVGQFCHLTERCKWGDQNEPTGMKSLRGQPNRHGSAHGDTEVMSRFRRDAVASAQVS